MQNNLPCDLSPNPELPAGLCGGKKWKLVTWEGFSWWAQPEGKGHVVLDGDLQEMQLFLEWHLY